MCFFFCFKQKTAYEMRISDWSSDVCSSDLPDRREEIAGVFAEAAASHDAVVTSGGASTGDEDHVKAAIEAAGGKLHFWRLAIKPGRQIGRASCRERVCQ